MRPSVGVSGLAAWGRRGEARGLDKGIDKCQVVCYSGLDGRLKEVGYGTDEYGVFGAG